ncbi:MAG TPA: cyclophilin-like fold protein [Thermoleophilia bacterium]|nr:cyclophilin-like fold protein [Thermoleophilia bacterium]
MLIVIEEAGVESTAELNDSATAAAIWSVLPLESAAQTWGAEVYFSVPVDSGPEDPHAAVVSGAVGYWPPGQAVCLFFGQQPVSPVNLIGVLEGDPSVLEAVQAGQVVRLEPLGATSGSS